MRQDNLYARLELITTDFDQPKAAKSSKTNQVWERSKAYLGQFGQALLKYFCGSQEPTISIKCDRDGNHYFAAYDPVNRERCTFHSEAELRRWLEQRYYR